MMIFFYKPKETSKFFCVCTAHSGLAVAILFLFSFLFFFCVFLYLFSTRSQFHHRTTQFIHVSQFRGGFFHFVPHLHRFALFRITNISENDAFCSHCICNHYVMIPMVYMYCVIWYTDAFYSIQFYS